MAHTHRRGGGEPVEVVSEASFVLFCFVGSALGGALHCVQVDPVWDILLWPPVLLHVPGVPSFPDLQPLLLWCQSCDFIHHFLHNDCGILGPVDERQNHRASLFPS